jgi:hypothetical protein
MIPTTPAVAASRCGPSVGAVGMLRRASTSIVRHSFGSSDIVVRWLDLVAGLGNRLSRDDRENSLPQDSLAGEL